VDALIRAKKDVVCFNATKYGGSLYKADKNLKVFNHTMDYKEIMAKLTDLTVSHVIDCTHPYAQVITRNLRDLTKEMKLPYFRYERPDDYTEGYESYESIVETLLKTEGNILVTTGSNNLAYFSDDLLERVYCRVLPTVNVVSKCIDLGFSPKQIIGMQGPFSKMLNVELMKSLDIKHLVTKASGMAGGFEDKIQAAESLGIETYVLKRPLVDKNHTYRDLDEVLKHFVTLE